MTRTELTIWLILIAFVGIGIILYFRDPTKTDLPPINSQQQVIGKGWSPSVTDYPPSGAMWATTTPPLQGQAEKITTVNPQNSQLVEKTCYKLSGLTYCQ